MDPLWFDEKIKNILNVKNNKLSWNIRTNTLGKCKGKISFSRFLHPK